MNAKLIDPNNHVPEVTPADVWDVDGLDSWNGKDMAWGGSVAVLPKKKAKPQGSAPLVTNDGAGLRIESKAQTRGTQDAIYQLSVREIDGTVLRLAPEVPVDKVRRQPVYQERALADEGPHQVRDASKAWGRSRHPSLRWMVGISLGVSSVVIAAMLVQPFINESNATPPRLGDQSLVVEEPEAIEDMDSWHDLLGQHEEAARIYSEFVRAATVEDILPMVRDSAGVEGALRQRHRGTELAPTWQAGQDSIWVVEENEGRRYAMLEGRMPDYSTFSTYWVMSDKRLLLDWEASTGYGTATFDELVNHRGDPSEIRGKILPHDYYTSVFPEADYQNYQLVSPDGSQTIWCYVRRDDPLDMVLGNLCQGEEILMDSPGQKKVTLRLAQGPAGSLANQWLIAGMHHKEWITP